MKVTYKKGAKGKVRFVQGPNQFVEEYLEVLILKKKKIVILKTEYNI